MKALQKFLVSFFLSLVVLFNTSVYSQAPDSTQSDMYNHAIQFYLVNEIIVAYKHNIASNSAIRFLVNATGLFKDKISDEQIIYENRYGLVQEREIINYVINEHFYETKIQYLYSIDINKLLVFYFGGGPVFNYQFRNSEGSDKRYNSSDSITYSYSNQTIERNLGLGISALAGLDCNIYENINMFVEYEGLVTRSWQRREFISNVTYLDYLDFNIWTFELKGLRMGLSVNF